MAWFDNEDKIELHSSVFIPVSREDEEIVFNHVYDIEKFFKWFNFIPVVWLSFNKKKLEVGGLGSIYFTMPFFYYKLKVTEVIPGKFIALTGTEGPMRGNEYYKFKPQKDGIVMEQVLILSGKNKFFHNYYVHCLVPNHQPFMNWRYSVLKKQIRKELEKTKKLL